MKLKISIRNMLVAFALVTMIVAWGASWWRHAMHQRKIVAKYRARVLYDYQVDSDGKRILNPRPPGPAWLRHWLGDDFFATVVIFNIQYHDDRAPVEDLSEICTLTGIKDLRLYFNCESLQSLEGLQKLKQLEHLVVSSFELTNCDALLGLQQLKTITFCFSKSLDLDLRRLEKLQRLESLRFRFTGQTNLNGVSKLRSLKSLACHQCDDLRSIDGIAGVRSLETLNLEFCQSIETLEPIGNLTSLKSLNLHSCVNASHIDWVAKLKHLEKLEIQYSKQLNDLSCIFGLGKLRYLDLYGSHKIPKKQIREMMEQLTNTGIITEHRDLYSIRRQKNK